MTIAISDSDLTIHHGDALETLRTLKAGSAHMCVTSPPFYGLRDYGVNGQIGLEDTPDQWCANLVQVFAEVKRVLRDDGTLWLEIGDSYNAGRSGGHPGGLGSLNEGRDMTQFQNRSGANVPGCKPKDLVGAPWLLAFALRTDGWYLRSDIIWARSNPMPESVTDRPTKAHSYVFLLAKQPRYYFDQEAVRERLRSPLHAPGNRERVTGGGQDFGDGRESAIWGSPAGRNIRTVWTIPTQPLPYDHYAAYPEALVERCVKAGTSERGVCRQCGAPWERQVERTPLSTPTYTEARGYSLDGGARDTVTRFGDGVSSVTTGWAPTCDHDTEPTPATVLDPFLGSGTTALVARRLGRKCIGIELNEDYIAIARERTQQLTLLG